VNQLSITPSSQTLAQLVFDASQLHADRIAIEEGDQIISYSELPDKVIRVTRALIAQGINQGDKVAIWAPNCADWVIIALGIQCAGAVMVPINTRMKGLEAANILSRSQSRLLFSVGTFLDVDYPALLDNHRPDGLEKMIIFGDSYKNNASPETGGNCSLDDFLETGSVISTEQAILTANSLTSEDIADLMFTSGTTGKPKGVLSSHGSTIRAFKEYVKVIGLIAGDRYLVVNPFFHSFGYKAGWVTCLLAGATILPHPVFNAEEVFQRITSDQITVLPGSPTLYLSMLAHPKLAETDLSSLRIAVTGAAAIPPILIERMRKELGFDVVTTAYGLTECGGLATICNPDDDIETIATTSGRAIPGTEIRIVDSDNQPLQSVGEPGQGWQIAMALLGFERGLSTLGQQMHFNYELELVIKAARASGAEHRPDIRRRVADAWIGLKILRYHALRVFSSNNSGTEALIYKYIWSNWHRDLGQLAMDVIGVAADVCSDDEAIRRLQQVFFFSRADTIYAGTNEIQLNIIAERGLQMPRESKN